MVLWLYICLDNGSCSCRRSRVASVRPQVLCLDFLRFLDHSDLLFLLLISSGEIKRLREHVKVAWGSLWWPQGLIAFLVHGPILAQNGYRI